MAEVEGTTVDPALMRSLIKCYLMRTHARKRVFQHKYFYKHLLKVFRWKNQIRDEVKLKKERRQQLKDHQQQIQLQQQSRQHSQSSQIMQLKVESGQQQSDLMTIEPQLKDQQQQQHQQQQQQLFTFNDTKISTHKHLINQQPMNCFFSQNQIINSDSNHIHNAKQNIIEPTATKNMTANSIGATVTPPSSMSSPFDQTTNQSDSGSSMIGTPCSSVSNSNAIILMQSSNSSSSNCLFSNRGSPSDSNGSVAGCISSSQISTTSSSQSIGQPWCDGLMMSPRNHHAQPSQPSAIASVLHESAAAAKAAAANGQQPMANLDIIRRNLWLMIVRKEILPAQRRRMNFRTEKLHKTKLAAHRCLSHFNVIFRKQQQKSYIYNQFYPQLTTLNTQPQTNSDESNHAID